jgi:tetratricopeptide (TPR) repeat protein
MLLSKVSAQSAKQDSLLARHLDESLPDTTRIRALLALGNTNYRFDSLLYFHQQFETKFQEKGTPTDILDHTLQKGIAYFRTAQNTAALSMFQDGAQQAEELADTARLITALFWQGNSNGVAYNIHLALKKYEELMALSEKIGDKNKICGTLANIGALYHLMKEYDQALVYFKQNLDCAKSQNKTLMECRVRNNIGVVYRFKKDNEKALEYMLPALEIAKENKYEGLYAAILSDVGTSQLELGHFSKAKSYFEQAQKIARSINSPVTVGEAQLGLARFYQNTQPDSAIYLARESLNIGKKIEFLGPQLNASKLLTELYQDNGQYKLALAMQSQWKVLDDSIHRSENQRAVHQLETRLEYEAQKNADQLVYERELAQQELKAQRQRFSLISVLGLIIIVFLSLLKFRKDLNKQERNKLLHEIELLKERVTAHAVSTGGVRQELSLNKDRIETHLGTSLGESSWNILTVIFDKPSISNKDLAEEVFLSPDGLSSSLRRMYKAFQVNTESSRNKKIALITKAMKISLASGMA